jgi:polysaccharide pyruvyl transferase WcaK-like protein
MKPARISFWGNFGAGNLGNETTLQTVIEQVRARLPDARLFCFCTNPADVQARHGIPGVRSEVWASIPRAGRAEGRVGKILRILFRSLPIEAAHWLKMLRAMWRQDLFIVAGTGIVADYMCGPTGWPYDMFKLTTLAALCRVRVVFLSVGVGPISHPLSRWFITQALRRACYRSYRDQASRQYLEQVGFRTHGDAVCPDVVFGLSERHFSHPAAGADQRRIIGLGLKDYSGGMGRLETQEYAGYLETMAAFVSWLHENGYAVRLLIGDFRYDSRVRDDLVALLERRGRASSPPLLIAEPSTSVEELLRQLGETTVVLSPRYHNLVMGMIQNKPAIALSDHAKLDAVLTELGLERYIVRLDGLDAATLIDRFRQLEAELGQLKPTIAARIQDSRQVLDRQYAAILAALGAPEARAGPVGASPPRSP